MELPELLSGDSRPVYQRVAEALRQVITSGQLEPGQRVPGENDLMRRYGLHRATAREALALLRNSGLIETVPRVGTFVRGFRPIYRYGSRRLRRERWADGTAVQAAELGDRDMSTDMLTVEEEPADARVASLLEVELGSTVVMRRRRYSVDDTPVQVAVSRLPATIAAGTRIADVDTGPGGTYARLAELGREPVSWVEELTSRMPTPEETDLLALPAGTPVVVVTRVAYTADEQAVEVNDMTFNGPAYVFVYDLHNGS